MSSLRSRTKAKSKAPLYKWSVILIRNRGQFLGFVEAPDAQTAEAAAVRAFDLDEYQRRRLMVRQHV